MNKEENKEERKETWEEATERVFRNHCVASARIRAKLREIARKRGGISDNKTSK